uniref:Ig-like domain-containing protein n=1 Tax=Cyclopterus lumpus TaxID=8103 RepID=A0A8C3GCF2_CYCLU
MFVRTVALCSQSSIVIIIRLMSGYIRPWHLESVIRGWWETFQHAEYVCVCVCVCVAPIQGLSLELSRLSGYEEMKCTAHGVFPAPRVTWATEPPTFVDLRPVTRMMADKQGLYAVDSRLKRLNGQPNLIYICKITTSYGGSAWTSSLRERVIRGAEGKDLTIPCYAPSYLNAPFLNWSFSNGKDSSHILTYDSRSGDSVSSPTWADHVELDGFRVPFGDGSLRLMDPMPAEHTGIYTCVFSLPHNAHTDTSEEPSYWWTVGLVVAVLVVAVVGVLVYLKLKGKHGLRQTWTLTRREKTA